MSSGSFKNCYLKTIYLKIVRVCEQDLLDNPEGLICHKTTKSNLNIDLIGLG